LFLSSLLFFSQRNKRSSVFVIFFAAISFVNARNLNSDSLQKVLKSAKDDSVKVNALNALSNLYFQRSDYSKSLYCGKQAQSLAEKIGFKKGLADSYYNLGRYHKYQGNFSLSLKHQMEALAIRKKINDKKGIANSYNNIGVLSDAKGDYPEALKNYLTALKIQEEIGDKSGTANSYNNIGLIYDHMDNYPEALKNLNIALKIHKQIANKNGIASVYGNIGNIYSYQENYPEALKNFMTSLQIHRETNDKVGIAICYSNIGLMYENQENYSEAIKHYNLAIDIQNEIGDKRSIIISCNNIGAILMQQNKPLGAEEYLNKALKLAKEIRYREWLKETYLNLSVLDSVRKDFKSSFGNYQMYISYKDSLSNSESTKKTVNLEMNYEFDKKENEAKILHEKKEAITLEEHQKQSVIIFTVCGILLLVTGFAIFAYRNYIQKQKANVALKSQKLIIEEKQKEILDSINYAVRIQGALLPQQKYIHKSISRLKGNQDE